ncbi:glutaredoxin-like domain-containing protein [Entophlyctis helioformis]|nr:glutaredoxin-like domain-containing protein [Entophlyctis helioformis]
MTMARRLLVTLYARKYCGLCDHAKEVIEAVQAKVPFDLQEVDIDKPENKAWWRQYTYEVPVVHLNGQEIFRHRLQPQDLHDVLIKYQQQQQQQQPPVGTSKQ